MPYADSVGAIRDLLDEGTIRLAGISNANPDADPRGAGDPRRPAGQRAEPVLARVPQQSQPELDLCAELGIAFLPWSPLGGIARAGDLGSRFAPFAAVAQAHGVSPQQVALAWELAQAAVVIPIPGASRPETIRDSVRAADLLLTPEELVHLDEA